MVIPVFIAFHNLNSNMDRIQSKYRPTSKKTKSHLNSNMDRIQSYLKAFEKMLVEYLNSNMDRIQF